MGPGVRRDDSLIDLARTKKPGLATGLLIVEK
jgi:hypothetical protein